MKYLKSLLLTLALALASFTATAGNATSAIEATVLTIATADAGVTAQAERYSYTSYREAQPERSTNVRAITGGVVGGALGALLTRNTGYSERYAAMSGLAAIGTALGNAADRRAERRRQQTGGRDGAGGYQVVLRLGNGETRAVFMDSLDPSIQPRSRVWLIGDSTIIPN